MAAPFNRNDSSVSGNLERGWRDRQLKATTKRADDADWREVDAIRQAHYAEQARKALAEAEQRNAKHTAKVSCPCCDHGTITVDLAERVIRALAVLPSASQPDSDMIAKLLTVAAGHEPNDPLSLHPSLNLHKPRRAAAVALAPVTMQYGEAPTDDESAIAALRREHAAREAEMVALARPVSDAEAAAVQAADDAEALAAAKSVETAIEPEPVSTRKHRGKRPAPLPFLDGGE